MKLNERFKQARIAAGFDSARSAETTALRHRTILNVEAEGGSEPGVTVLLRLCKRYGRSPNELLGWPKRRGKG